MSLTEITDSRQYLTFKLGDEVFATDVSKVREVLDFPAVTKIPRAPDFMSGVINLRGSVVPVVDLSIKFGQEPCPTSRRTCIIIMETMLRGERATMGVVADSVSQVIQFAPQDIEPAPAFGSRVRIEYLEGMAKMGSKFVLILNMDEVFARDEVTIPIAGAPAVSLGSTGDEAIAP